MTSQQCLARLSELGVATVYEITNAGARLILAPDWQTIVWSEEEGKQSQAWGLRTVKSFHTRGMLPVELSLEVS